MSCLSALAVDPRPATLLPSSNTQARGALATQPANIVLRNTHWGFGGEGYRFRRWKGLAGGSGLGTGWERAAAAVGMAGLCACHAAHPPPPPHPLTCRIPPLQSPVLPPPPHPSALPLTPRTSPALPAAAVPWWGWVGGFLGAFYVAVVVVYAPVLGAATLMALFVCCQLATAVLLDSMGWVGFR